MGFHFSLEKVLQYKRQIENKRQSEYAEILARLNAKEMKLKAMTEKFQETLAEFDRKKRESCTLENIFLYENYLNSLSEDIKKERVIVEKIQQEAEDYRNILIEAKIDVTGIEKLREKKEIAFQINERKKEENAMEEFVANRRSLNI